MKASFKNLTIQPSLKGAAETVDLTDAVAEAVYQTATNFAQHTLAHRIAESGEEGIELTDADAKVIKAAVGQFKFFVQKPILEAIGEKFD